MILVKPESSLSVTVQEIIISTVIVFLLWMTRRTRLVHWETRRIHRMNQAPADFSSTQGWHLRGNSINILNWSCFFLNFIFTQKTFTCWLELIHIEQSGLFRTVYLFYWISIKTIYNRMASKLCWPILILSSIDSTAKRNKIVLYPCLYPTKVESLKPRVTRCEYCNKNWNQTTPLVTG